MGSLCYGVGSLYIFRGGLIMDKETRIKDLERMLRLCHAVDGLMQLSMKFDKYGINKTIVEIKEEIEKLEEENNGKDI